MSWLKKFIKQLQKDFMKTNRNFKNLSVSNHPLILSKLAKIRDKKCSHSEFRRLLEDISLLLFYEASSEFTLNKIEIKTPLEKTKGVSLEREILLVPILRAGLGMMNGIIKIIPEARVGMVGVYRDENNFKPIDYYNNLPKNLNKYETILIDPMLATGGSAKFALDIIKKRGAKNIKMIFILCAPEGIKVLQKAHPDIKIYAASLDRQLNDQAYILPGLGDAGDRYFGI